METLRDILINIILLFGLVFMISLSNSRIKFKHRWMDVVFGLMIGLVTIFIMLNAWEMQEGVFYDTRSVMIGVTSLFFSYITGFVAAVTAVAYRIYVGGAGVYAGVLSILLSLLIGWIWKVYIDKKLKFNRFLKLYLYGVIIHIFVVLSQFFLPYPDNITVIKNVGIIMLTFFPIATMLLGIAVWNHEKRITSKEKILQSERKYRSLINSSKLGIIQFNDSGEIEIANQAFADILSTEIEKLIGLNMFELPNKKLVNRVKQALNGEIAIYDGYYQSYLTKKTFPARVQFSPIYMDNKISGGIGIIEDLTEDYKNKEKIQELLRIDNLTKLNNRATFDSYILSHQPALNYPISIITFDINTFQVINTSFGYEMGNNVLIKIGETLLDYAKNNANIDAFRIGGDEFALILTNTEINEADDIGKEIKNIISKLDDFNFVINISYGVDETDNLDKSLSETYNQSLVDLNSNKIYDGSSISIKTIDLIMTTLFEKNKRERMHSERVSYISKKIAEKFNLGTAFTNRVELAGRLHDIGKINISEEILDKPGKLTDREWKSIKKHPESGFKILSSVPEYLDIANIVLTHHERYDGKGYPRGISGHNIPLEARIICVADAYDAMIEERPYRLSLTEDQAIKELIDNKGTQFDPEVVDKFITITSNNEL
jgi:diguanylate cyclase (GGDEF)-like protein/PAS domain S-box-containing protein